MKHKGKKKKKRQITLIGKGKNVKIFTWTRISLISIKYFYKISQIDKTSLISRFDRHPVKYAFEQQIVISPPSIAFLEKIH